MALISEDQERTLIPNWRDYTRTLKMQELANKSKPLVHDIDISRSLNDWRNDQNIGIAADLINSSFISGKTDFVELNQAIEFIINNNESQSLIGLAHAINGIHQSPNIVGDELLGNNIDLNPQNLHQLSFPDDQQLFRLIKKTKSKAFQQLYNPIPWVELARLYSVFGQVDKAEKSMLVAVHLAPNNRFVLRSATRFWAHLEDYERALYYLRKSEITVKDPWLVSAHIATSSLMNRYSPLIKSGVKLLESKNFSNYDLTELSSSLGTLEYNSGSFKKSKDLFILSMQSPNDNSLAQLEWLAKRDKQIDFNPFAFTNVQNPFEAFAREDKANNNWKNAFVNTVKWFFDLPYSTGPVLMGSFIASSFLSDQSLAITLCEAGLKANPGDYSILNNMIYAHARNNTIDECRNYIEAFQRIKIEDLTDEWKITYIATNGLIAFKYGNVSLGKKLYLKAYEEAVKQNNVFLQVLALINFLRELINIRAQERHEIFHLLTNSNKQIANNELIVLMDEVSQLYFQTKDIV
ncbi:tetratricopeptide repeat protein [Pedobacter sp. KLB.chiD]|uniref:tetratricopeptide repeat protein n=1 Tax=Pedobacter sp. KLB.chiD TaxID=3387402 RepID=UPI00399B082C